MLEATVERAYKLFSPSILREAEANQRVGGVLQVRFSDGLVKARVKSKSNQIHHLHFDLRSWPKIPSRCTCEKVKNCAHAVAALLELKLSRDTAGSANAAAKPNALPMNKPDVFLGSTPHGFDIEHLNWYSNMEPLDKGMFGYELGILVDGKKISILPLLLSFLSQLDGMNLDDLSDEQPLCFNTPTGVLRLRLGRIKPLINLLLQHGSSVKLDENQVKIKAYQQLLFSEIESQLPTGHATTLALKDYFEQLNLLANPESLPEIPTPKHLQTTLRDYQQRGLNWLQALRRNAFDGILADDMGLGKTIQTLAHLMHEKEQSRMKSASLIVAPTSLLWNWYQEAKRFAPDLKCIVYHGTRRHQIDFSKYELIISTYGLVQRDITRFEAYPFYYVILDEAQLIKNATSKTTQMVRRLQSNHRLCLSGTPMENHLGELWSLFHFLMPGMLGSAKHFATHFRVPIEKHHDLEKQTLLLKRISPFLLRRTKQEVLQELPSKTETILSIELTGKQRDLYETIRVSMEKKVRDILLKQGLGQSRIFFLDALLKLRQVACDPRLLSLPESATAHGNSAKLDALMGLLQNLVEEGRSILIFSQFTSMLALIEERCVEQHYSYLKLTGKTVNRQELVDRFQAGEAQLFLISLKAGGKGLNLTQADTVIHYDPWWNPAVEDQATDRSHRIGQDRPVFVYKLIAAGTVEEVVVNLQNRKQTLFTRMLPNQQQTDSSFGEKDLEMFFSKSIRDRETS